MVPSLNGIDKIFCFLSACRPVARPLISLTRFTGLQCPCSPNIIRHHCFAHFFSHLPKWTCKTSSYRREINWLMSAALYLSPLRVRPKVLVCASFIFLFTLIVWPSLQDMVRLRSPGWRNANKLWLTLRSWWNLQKRFINWKWKASQMLIHNLIESLTPLGGEVFSWTEMCTISPVISRGWIWSFIIISSVHDRHRSLRINGLKH